MAGAAEAGLADKGSGKARDVVTLEWTLEVTSSRISREETRVIGSKGKALENPVNSPSAKLMAGVGRSTGTGNIISK